MRSIDINGRWPLVLPDHRADRPEWPYWEATRLAAMHAFIEPGDVVYDIGAEAGDFSALFATWGAQVVLIEPNPKAWPTIRSIWEANDLKKGPKIPMMVSDHSTECPELYWSQWPQAAYEPIDTEHGFHHIGQSDDPTTTVDDLQKALPIIPDVLTMDVEGGEGHVIRGAHRVLSEIKPAVFMSIHPQFMADLYGEHPNEIHDAMRDYGYQARFLCEDHEQHWVWTHPERRMFPGVAEDYYRPGDRVIL